MLGMEKRAVEEAEGDRVASDKVQVTAQAAAHFLGLEN